jgi:hypothetical protein
MIVKGRVTHAKGKHPIAHAKLALIDDKGNEVKSAVTGEDGYYVLSDIPEGKYKLRCKHFGDQPDKDIEVLKGHDRDDANCDFDLRLQLSLLVDSKPATAPIEGRRLVIHAESAVDHHIDVIRWKVFPEARGVESSKSDYEIVVPFGARSLFVQAVAIEKPAPGFAHAAHATISEEFLVLPAETYPVQGDVAIKGPVRLHDPVGVRLLRTASDPTLDQALWVAIRNRTGALSFDRYQKFMNCALAWEERNYKVPEDVPIAATKERIERDLRELGTNLHGVRAYQTLKLLTETFLLMECGVRLEREDGRHRVPFDPGEEVWRLGQPFTFEVLEEKLRKYLGDRRELPYITRVVKAAFPELEREDCSDRLIAAKINEPCLIELIWSYWMEEGMLVQTMNALSRRFQNVRASGGHDPLLGLAIDPLRALSNLLWGYIQDEFNRLTVRRRAYEYLNHYGLTLYGKAASNMNAADSRSKFLEAFHNLLYRASVFFKEDYQTTVIADAFPLLNSLKEVHVILAQGAENQFGDLPWTARVEMLLMQYMLARREIRDFLQSRLMVPYKERWEAQVDAMKALQGWTDVSVGQFRDLAVYGEQLLLSIRYGDWIAVNDEDSSRNWARFFRPEIQAYLHAYRAVTGIDLTNAETVDATIPGIHLQRRMAMQRTH